MTNRNVLPVSASGLRPGRPLPCRPCRFPASRHRLHPNPIRLGPDPTLDEIAAKVTGPMVNAGINDPWSRGQPLDQPLATYTWLAQAASRRNTAGLWTLIAWIHWRSNDRQAAWPALHLALDIDPDQDPPHYLAVFMYDHVDPALVPPVRFR